MSEAKQTIAQLADDACAMPWEDKAPFSARYAFKEAVTPELFTEMLQALRKALPRLAHTVECHSTRPTAEWPEHGSASFDGCQCAIKLVRAAIAKATGGAS